MCPQSYFPLNPITLFHCLFFATFLAKLKWLQYSTLVMGKHSCLLRQLFRQCYYFPLQQKLTITSAPRQFTGSSFQKSRFPRVGFRFQFIVLPHFRRHMSGSPSDLNKGLPGLIRGKVQTHLGTRRIDVSKEYSPQNILTTLL